MTVNSWIITGFVCTDRWWKTLRGIKPCISMERKNKSDYWLLSTSTESVSCTLFYTGHTFMFHSQYNCALLELRLGGFLPLYSLVPFDFRCASAIFAAVVRNNANCCEDAQRLLSAVVSTLISDLMFVDLTDSNLSSISESSHFRLATGGVVDRSHLRIR